MGTRPTASQRKGPFLASPSAHFVIAAAPPSRYRVPFMRVWIVNPFDELPGETDLPQRYWALARELAARGHEVLWWSSDFSHRRKEGRSPPPDTEGFRVRLVPTPPYRRNVGLARSRNHRSFARRFLREALADLDAGRSLPPARIVVSLPPLGTADAAFAIRERVNRDRTRMTDERPASPRPGAKTRTTGRTAPPTTATRCEVVLDVMDAWPETFHRLLPLPQPLRRALGPIFFAPWHAKARRAFRRADRISAVGDRYLDLARRRARSGTPLHRCYHGVELGAGGGKPDGGAEAPASADGARSPPGIAAGGGLKLVYIGALERSYDLGTAIQGVRRLNREGLAVTLDVAGAGTRAGGIARIAAADPYVRFHGLLGREALRSLLSECHLGLIPLAGDSWVGLPYKMADYAAAGLPVLSSLDGECRRLLETKKAGTFYRPGSEEEFCRSVRRYADDERSWKEESANARRMAEEEFDRTKTYPALANFVEDDEGRRRVSTLP